MQIQSILRTGVLVVAISLATACGDSSGPDYEDVMHVSMAGEVGEWSYYALQDVFFGMNAGYAIVGIGAPPAPSAMRLGATRVPRFTLDPRDPAALKATLQAVLADGCSTSASGTDEGPWDPYDGNDNGIADDWTIDVTCVYTDEPSEGVTRVETTKYGMRVKEKSGVLWGFDATSYSSSHEVYSDGDDEYWRVDLLHNASVTPTAATSRYRSHYQENYRNDGVTDALDQVLEAELAFDPDVNISTMGALPDGDLTITGDARILDEEGNYGFEFSTPTAWRYSNECDESEAEQPFVAGVLLGLFNGDPDVGYSITWGACGDGSAFESFGGEGGIVEPPVGSRMPFRGDAIPRR